MSDAKQTTTQTPGGYPEGGLEIWVNYLNKFFGNEETEDVGLESLLQQKQDYLKDLYAGSWDEYQKQMQPAIQDYKNKLQKTRESAIPVSFGGKPMGEIIPQRPQELAQKELQASTMLPNKALSYATKFGPEVAPGQAERGYLSQLGSLGLNMQNLRYGLPTQQTQANFDRGTMSQIGDIVGLGSSIFDLGSEIGWENIGDKLGGAYDWLTGLFGS